MRCVRVLSLMLILFLAVRSCDLSFEDKVKILVRQPGWRDNMSDIAFYNSNEGRNSNRIRSVILATSIYETSDSVNFINTSDKCKHISFALRCKYGELIVKYKNDIQVLMSACRNIRRHMEISDLSDIQIYRIKSLCRILDDMSKNFKCMKDTLELVASWLSKKNHKKNILTAVDKLEKYTSGISEQTISSLDREYWNATAKKIKNVTRAFVSVVNRNMDWFFRERCVFVTKHSTRKSHALHYNNWKQSLTRSSSLKKPFFEYLETQIRSYLDEFEVEWFHKLGFRYNYTQDPPEVEINTVIFVENEHTDNNNDAPLD